MMSLSRMSVTLRFVINPVRHPRYRACLFRNTFRSWSSDRRARISKEPEYLTNLSQWWKNWKDKVKPTAPNCSHKSTNELLQIDGCYNKGWDIYTPGKREASMANTKKKHACWNFKDPGLAEERLWSNQMYEGGFRSGVQPDAFQSQQREERRWEMLNLEEALSNLNSMAKPPSIENIICILQKCRKEKSLAYAKRLHAYICKNRMEAHKIIGNYIVPMFVECGSMLDANKAFNRLTYRNVHSWTSLMFGYVQCGEMQRAFDLYQQMQEHSVRPSKNTLIALLKACTRLKDAERGREVHIEILNKGLDTDIFVGSTLVDMYAKCGSLPAAQEVFDKLPVRDVVSWTALIAGYAEHGLGHDSLKCLEQMEAESISPNAVTFVCCLKACGSIGAIDKGREIHTEITKRGLERDLFVGTALVHMYSKCGSLLEAQENFDNLPVRNVVSWTALIVGYAEHGLGDEVLKCFEQMQLENISPDAVTYVCILKACGITRAIGKGREIHTEMKQKGFEGNPFIGNALVDMYAKCGSLSEAHRVFNNLSVQDIISWNALIAGYAQYGPTQEALGCFNQMQLKGVRPDVVSWTSLIAGYAEHGPGQEAIRCFEQMQLDGILPNAVTIVCCLKACGNIGALGKGREVHTEFAGKGFNRDPFIGNTLIDMYAKCGSLSEAWEVFGKLPTRNVVSWNAMINGYGMNHESGMAGQCFKDMQEQGVKPNAITFTCLLAACSRASLVFKGQQYFKMMREDYGILPTIEHCTCMVDLLARSGYLYEAEKFLESMPCPPSIETWTALLSACKTYGEVELGCKCFEQLVQINPVKAASYVFMADLYASAGRRDDVYRIEELRKAAGAKKKPASALIEVNQKVHEFVVGNNQSSEISAMLEIMNSCVVEKDHAPNLDMVLKPISNEEKEADLCEHVEKMALAFGLLHTPQGQTLHVTKNMRMCNNCHNASKIISRIEKREIIVRDGYCIHHFKDGLCSCAVLF